MVIPQNWPEYMKKWPLIEIREEPLIIKRELYRREANQMIDRATEIKVVALLEQINFSMVIDRKHPLTEQVIEVVKKMELVDQEILMRKYLHIDSDSTSHTQIYNDMGLTEAVYRNSRLRGLTNLTKEMGFPFAITMKKRKPRSKKH